MAPASFLQFRLGANNNRPNTHRMESILVGLVNFFPTSAASSPAYKPAGAKRLVVWQAFAIIKAEIEDECTDNYWHVCYLLVGMSFDTSHFETRDDFRFLLASIMITGHFVVHALRRALADGIHHCYCARQRDRENSVCFGFKLLQIVHSDITANFYARC